MDLSARTASLRAASRAMSAFASFSFPSLSAGAGCEGFFGLFRKPLAMVAFAFSFSPFSFSPFSKVCNGLRPERKKIYVLDGFFVLLETFD